MKTKKDLLIGIIIGIGLIIVPLILMGAKSLSNMSEGTYQISTSYGHEDSSTNPFVYETIIDTRSGKVISRDRKLAIYY